MYKNILIATDGSELAEKAVREGINLAKDLGAKVILFTASPAFRLFETDSSMFGVKSTACKEVCARRAGEDLAPAGQRDRQGTHAFQDTGARVPVSRSNPSPLQEAPMKTVARSAMACLRLSGG